MGAGHRECSDSRRALALAPMWPLAIPKAYPVSPVIMGRCLPRWRNGRSAFHYNTADLKFPQHAPGSTTFHSLTCCRRGVTPVRRTYSLGSKNMGCRPLARAGLPWLKPASPGEFCLRQVIPEHTPLGTRGSNGLRVGLKNHADAFGSRLLLE